MRFLHSTSLLKNISFVTASHLSINSEHDWLTEGARSNYYLPELLNSQLGNKLLPMS
jgi:hypothetical protein